jgi:hypothetical protein
MDGIGQGQARLLSQTVAAIVELEGLEGGNVLDGVGQGWSIISCCSSMHRPPKQCLCHAQQDLVALQADADEAAVPMVSEAFSPLRASTVASGR